MSTQTEFDLIPPKLSGSMHPWTENFKEDQKKDTEYLSRLDNSKESWPEYVLVGELRCRTRDLWEAADYRHQRRKEAIIAFENRRMMLLHTLSAKIRGEPENGVTELARRYTKTLQDSIEQGLKEYDIQAAIIKLLEDADKQRRRVELLNTIDELAAHLRRRGDTV